jgi:adenosylcobinamide-phosphate synthase
VIDPFTWFTPGGVAVAAAIAVAAGLDAAVGEPPGRVHPVALFGRVVEWVDREWRRPRLAGTLAASAFPLMAAGVATLTVLVAGAVGRTLADWTGDPWVALAAPTLAAGGVLFTATSLRMLLTAASEVVEATADGDRETARRAVRALVGRDTDDLGHADLRSAAVESLAENLADGLVAPLAGALTGVGVAGALGAAASAVLAVGAGGAAWVKAVNTMDSMLGYRSKPVGWAAARLDDAVVFLPARASAVLLAVAAGSPGALAGARGAASAPPSPNSGWPMATLAAALAVRLTKPGVYDLRPSPDATLPTVAEGRRAIRVVAVAGTLAWVGAAILAAGLA